MSPNQPELSDRELWLRAATAREDVPGSISEMELAAWLDGRLTEAEAAGVERALATDPTLRQAALELSEVLGQPFPAPPQRLLVRAHALVGFDAERAKPRASVLATVIRWRFSVQRAAVASFAVVIAIAGFMMGGGLGSSYAQERQVKAADPLSELSDLFNDGSL